MSVGTIVYIDGFNFYHAVDDLGEPRLKWADLWSLSEKLLRPGQQLVAVKYFTAYATWRPASYRRHQRYVAALEARGVTPIIGRFKAKTGAAPGAAKMSRIGEFRAQSRDFSELKGVAV